MDFGSSDRDFLWCVLTTSTHYEIVVFLRHSLFVFSYEISPSFPQIFILVGSHADGGGVDGWSGIGNLGGASGRNDGGGTGDRGIRVAGIGKRTF